MAVSVSTIVADLRTAITQLVDDIDGLHVGVSHSSLTTVMGLSKEGAVPSVDDRTSHFENDTTFAELMEADDDASAADYLARSVALGHHASRHHWALAGCLVQSVRLERL